MWIIWKGEGNIFARYNFAVIFAQILWRIEGRAITEEIGRRWEAQGICFRRVLHKSGRKSICDIYILIRGLSNLTTPKTPNNLK